MAAWHTPVTSVGPDRRPSVASRCAWITLARSGAPRADIAGDHLWPTAPGMTDRPRRARPACATRATSGRVSAAVVPAVASATDDPTARSSARPPSGRGSVALAIPPAWTDVWICPDPAGHLQATGRDARGRKQYRYHAAVAGPARRRQVRPPDRVRGRPAPHPRARATPTSPGPACRARRSSPRSSGCSR